MTNILERVASSNARRYFNSFEPASTQDVFALALATKLDDSSAAAYYGRLCQQYSQQHLLAIYRKAVQTQSDLPRHRVFHDHLKTSQSGVGPMGRPVLMAIRIERRAVAIAILHGDDCEWTRVRQLSSSFDKAQSSTAFFLSKTLSAFPVKFAAMEIIPNGHEYHRSQLTTLIASMLRERSVSIAEVHKREIFSSFGHPAKRSRKEVRDAITRIYPFERFSGSGAPFIQDALALGLHVHTASLFRQLN